MSDSFIPIPFHAEERDWLIDQARSVTKGKEVDKESLFAKLRSFGDMTYKFLYQKELQLKVAEIARLIYDQDQDLAPGTREMANTALCYFMHSVDIIPDDQPFVGYLDDYLLISILYQDLGLPAPQILK